MSNPYSSQTISNYNSSPPPDDGSQTTANQITWAGIKAKLADPIKTYVDAIQTAVSAAFQALSTAALTDTANSFTATQTLSGAALNEAQGANIASASSIDLGDATGNYVKITGTTAITALGTVQAGTRRIVEFAGALTLTHNATSLILPGGANITTAAGDVATFVSEGSGNWRCVNYTRGGAKPMTKASQSEMEAQTADKAATADNMKWHPAMPKAWAYVTVSGGVATLAASYGISGLTRGSAGGYNLTFSTPFSSTAYVALPALASSDGSGADTIKESTNNPRTTTTWTCLVESNGTNVDPASFGVAFFGDQ